MFWGPSLSSSSHTTSSLKIKVVACQKYELDLAIEIIKWREVSWKEINFERVDDLWAPCAGVMKCGTVVSVNNR